MDQGSVVDVKASIRSLIIATNHRMTIADLQRDYIEIVGTPLPYKTLGLESAEQLLRSIPDVVQVIGRGSQALVECVPNTKSKHIAVLVQNQKNDNRRRRKRLPKKHRQSAIQSPVVNSLYPDEIDEEIDAFMKLSINKLNSVPHRNQTSITSFTSSNESNGSDIKNPVSLENVSKSNHNLNERKSITTAIQKGEPTVHHKQNSQVEDDINNPNDHFSNASKDSSDSIKSNTNEAISDTQPLPTTKTRNAILFGINFAQKNARKTYNEATLKTAMIKDIENIRVIGEENHQKKTTMSRFKKLEIPKCNLYDDLNEGSIFSLYISEIRSGFEFYFHIHKENHELVKLEERMRETYSLLAENDHVLRDIYLEPGIFCAVEQNNSWYRAKVLEVPPNLNDFQKVKLFFIDYGCINHISFKKLKFLAPLFYSVPIQAARARLALIKTNERSQSITANDYFTSLVNGRCLYAYVNKVDKEKPCFDLILLDTNKRSMLNINKSIIKKRLADKE